MVTFRNEEFIGIILFYLYDFPYQIGTFVFQAATSFEYNDLSELPECMTL